ncbi:MAG: hypothetical protein JSV89_21760 [Spirochaetaceae bacterium]|nr:MAG: hypothetical protein JSV89_21760 [Spirochaetaceae bacterium]
MDFRPALRLSLYVLLVVLMLLTLYAIFNAGNPNSLFRLLVKDPSYDIAITVALAVCSFALVLLLTLGGGQNRLRHLLEINAGHIQDLRRKGKSDLFIAESFLSELGVKSGILYRLAKRRVLRYLSKL